MNNRRFFLTLMLAVIVGIAVGANQNPLSVLEQEMSKQSGNASSAVADISQPSSSTNSDELVLIDEEAENAARIAAEQKAAEEAARIEAERKAIAEEKARLEEQRKAAEQARLEAEQKAAEAAAQKAAELKAKQQADSIAAAQKAEEEAAKALPVVMAAPVPEQNSIEAQLQAIEQERTRLEAERKAAEQEKARLEELRKQEEQARNSSSKDITDKMIDALLETQRAALRQAAKADSIQQLQRRQEERIRELEAMQNQQPGAALRYEPAVLPQQPAQNPATVVMPIVVTPQPEMQQQEETGYLDMPAEKLKVGQRWYNYSGRNMLSILSVGYSTCFLVGPGSGPAAEYAFRRHIISLEIFEWRTKWFGMQMFNFEIGLNTPDPDKNVNLFEYGGKQPDQRLTTSEYKAMWFAYKPAVKFYIPCTKWLAVELYGGAEMDMTKLWNRISNTWYTDIPGIDDSQNIPEQNWFLSAFGGVGVMLTGVPAIPLEIKAEYRHPIQGNTALIPQGIYISAQLHLAAPLKRQKKQK